MTEVALNKLIQWDGNVRKTNAAEGIDELSASIAAHGLLNPLTVTAIVKGKYAVVAGQRRLMALQALAAEGKIGKTASIECNVVSNDADLTEISLAENVVRTAMHPADQFDAWRELAEKGSSAADIAARFGVSDGVVTKRLKLGRVSPKIMQVYRDGKISLSHVEAFTVSDDHAEQERVWEGMSNWSGPSDIRRALTQGEVAASDKRVRFIGLDAYEAAGGPVRRDLFDDQNGGWVSDPVLLDQLVSEKLETLASEIRAEGWGFVEVRDGFDWDERKHYDTLRGKPAPLTSEEEAERTKLAEEYDELAERANNEEELSDEEQERMDALESRVEQIDDRPDVFTDEAKASSGVIVTLDYHGEPDIMRGLFRRDNAPRAAATDDTPKVKSAFSAALVDDLMQEVTAAMQAEYAVNPKVALVAVVHAFAMRRSFEAAVKLSGESAKVPSQGQGREALAKAEGEAMQGKPEDGGSLWAWLESQPQDRLLAMLAVLTAQHVTADAKGAPALRTALGGNLRDWFTPNAENYFGRVSRDQILKDMTEWGIDTKAYASMKKAALAEVAERHVVADWVPPPMRIG